jgi:hypothetical protein
MHGGAFRKVCVGDDPEYGSGLQQARVWARCNKLWEGQTVTSGSMIKQREANNSEKFIGTARWQFISP